jgi:hypothetical protein
MIIENKPRSSNVWFDQLNPSKKNLSEEVTIYEKPVILEWKEIIKHLCSLQSITTISGYEKIMIGDFLSFVDEKFIRLNPYDNFFLCKDNEELINRRIENILKNIVRDPSVVRYHRGWGYYIGTQLEQIKKIGLILWKNETDWGLSLSLYFGDSQGQARCFYNSSPETIKMKAPKDWKLCSNFHVSFGSRNLVWFESDESDISIEEYIKFWVKNIDLISQRKKEDVKNFLDDLKNKRIISYDGKKQEEMESSYFSKAMQTLNICPGFGMIYNISSKEAKEKDKASELEDIIINKIKEGLSIINLDCKDILRPTMPS